MLEVSHVLAAQPAQLLPRSPVLLLQQGAVQADPLSRVRLSQGARPRNCSLPARGVPGALQLQGFMAAWLLGWLPACLAACLAAWLLAWLAAWLLAWLSGYLPGWLHACLAADKPRWLAGCLAGTWKSRQLLGTVQAARKIAEPRRVGEASARQQAERGKLASEAS